MATARMGGELPSGQEQRGLSQNEGMVRPTVDALEDVRRFAYQI